MQRWVWISLNWIFSLLLIVSVISLVIVMFVKNNPPVTNSDVTQTSSVTVSSENTPGTNDFTVTTTE